MKLRKPSLFFLCLLGIGAWVFACEEHHPLESAVTGAHADAAPFDAASLCQPSALLTPTRGLSILMLTKETLFHHAEAHAAGDVAVPTYLRGRGHTVTVSDDSSYFDGDRLLAFDVIMFFVTSGKVVSEPSHRDAFVRFVHAGRGVVGTHTATATDNDWRFMYELMGASFGGHGSGDAQVTSGRLGLADPSTPFASYLPAPWTRTDEWYFFDRNPILNANLKPLLLLDETSLARFRPLYPDVAFYGDAGHPLAWTQEYQCARVFYTALGHTAASYTEDLFLRHLATGLEWVGAPATAKR